MNKDRRKRIDEAIKKLEDAQTILEECRDEEQDYLDNIPENLQGSERYETAEAAVDALDSACENLEEVISSAEEATY
jgi:hypothetical protein